MKKSVECTDSSLSVCLGRFDAKVSRMFSYLSFMLYQSTPAYTFFALKSLVILVITGLCHLSRQNVCLPFSGFFGVFLGIFYSTLNSLLLFTAHSIQHFFTRNFQGHLEISASALASASAFQYKYGFLHSINNL